MERFRSSAGSAGATRFLGRLAERDQLASFEGDRAVDKHQEGRADLAATWVQIRRRYSCTSTGLARAPSMDPLSVDIGGNDPVAVLRANYSVEIEPVED